MSENYRSVYDGIEVVGDGDMLCARFDDFEDLQVSPAGFGKTDAEAIAALATEVQAESKKAAARISRLEAVVEKLVTCCERLQWPVFNEVLLEMLCAFCQHTNPGHADDCEMAAALADAQAALAEKETGQ